MTAFAAALSVLHADANLSEAGYFRRPPGAWTAVRVVRSSPDATGGGLGAIGVRTLAHQADVIAADLAVAPMRGDELRIGATVYRVEESAPDNLGLSYRLGLSVVAVDPAAVVGTFVAGVDTVE